MNGSEQQGFSKANSLRRSPTSLRNLLNRVMDLLVFVCVALALLPLLAVLIYVTVQGASSLSPSVFTQLPPPPNAPGGGFGNAIQGTLIMVAIGAAISIPFGVMAAIYLSEFSTGNFAGWIRFATNVLSGVPSIIVGVFTFGVIVLSLGFSGFAGGVALSILMLPIIVRTTDEALKLVPGELRQAAVGLGATKLQTVLRIVLPAALPAIITGTTLAIARAAGETAPLLFTAVFWDYWKTDPFKGPMASLAVLIYNFAQVPYTNQLALAWAASLILVLLVLITSVASRLATARRTY
ncbi:MAG: phosphate ABC transporter permease PstA [Chroococcidiopsidaceae cyanobacterium CP_BM_RX_35]|nr:phosphate ABC transporter permease PstA [Chroococcidiopsidaceae cyanobacterium CP_BM_RX_35]